MAESLENRGKLRELIDKFQFVDLKQRTEKNVFVRQIELKSEGKQVAYIVCNEKVISVIGYRENE